MRLLTLEAIPLSTMEKGLPWDWESFPQWMDSLAKRPLGVNVGALVPFNPLRLYVMGIEESRERVDATAAETRHMQALVHEAMKAGRRRPYPTSAAPSPVDRTGC
jgi:N-acyl-D-aspartate/D-glutamate deacylase